MSNLKNKTWLDYINVLQDRERKKISSVGISNWVIFASIGGLGYFMFPDISLIKQNFQYLVLSYALFFNLTISLFDIFNRKYRTEKIIDYRNQKIYESTQGIANLERDAETLTLFLGIGINVWMLTIYPEYMYIFIPFLIRYLFNAISLIYYSNKDMIEAIKKSQQEKKNELNLNRKTTRYLIKPIMNLIIYTLYILLNPTVLFFICTIPFIHKFFFANMDTYYLKLNLYGLILALITLMIQFLTYPIFVKRMKIRWLENFERKIIVEEFSEEKIKNVLVQEYFGLGTIDDFF